MNRFLSIILVFSAICWGNSSANALSNEQTPTEIIISSGDPFGGVPRTFIPISGYVFDGIIYLNFSSSLGDVDIHLYESSLGLVLSTVVDSTENPVAIPFCGSQGSYSITFELEDGSSFIGRFEIE